MHNFVYDALPSRVVFGYGALGQIRDELARLGCERGLILSTPRQRQEVQALSQPLGERLVGVYEGAVMHVPAEVANAARLQADACKADCYIALGGGSTIGLAKAIAMSTGRPIVAVPTTYSGSEMTPIWGITEDGIKRTGRDPRVLPRCVIYDPSLTLTMPAKLSGPSGINAIAHCVEALYSENANPITSLIAEEGIAALGRSLPIIVQDPTHREARADALYGAYLAGAALGAVGMALHHKLCHTLGGSYALPHAPLHTVILPHVAHYNRHAAPDAMKRIARALDADDAPTALYNLAVTVGAKTSLKDIGMRREALGEAAEIACRNPYHNPRPVTAEGVLQLLQDAYDGRRPGI